ncbi:MAG: beta-lactamase domain protein [Conexibacter sp.]|nr:beta-lactamase domain protein [Conexibacter sp.]
MSELLANHDVALVRAANPGPYTLDGTNSWIVGRAPAWVIDPGPALDAHLDAVAAQVRERGGLGGIALTHDHPDHADGVPGLRARFGGAAPVAAARGDVELLLAGGDRAGPLEAVATPGHAPDHLAFVVGRIGFSGDVVLGRGSTLLLPDPGALAGYIDGLRRLRARRLELLCPGHGPLVEDPAAKLDDYLAHRLERERRVVAALEAGARSVDELLATAWPDAPAELRRAATVTLAAHLDKLADEGRLPAGVERPQLWPPPRGET